MYNAKKNPGNTNSAYWNKNNQRYNTQTPDDNDFFSFIFKEFIQRWKKWTKTPDDVSTESPEEIKV